MVLILVVILGGVYIVLWREFSGVYTLLDYELLDGPHEHDVIDSAGDLQDWSTIVVQVIESSAGNSISGFVQGTSSPCCDRDEITWDYSNFTAVHWFINHPQPIDDVSSFTLRSSDPPTEEMGIHAFYDNPNNNDIFFDAFSMRILGPDGKVFFKPIQH